MAASLAPCPPPLPPGIGRALPEPPRILCWMIGETTARLRRAHPPGRPDPSAAAPGAPSRRGGRAVRLRGGSTLSRGGSSEGGARGPCPNRLRRSARRRLQRRPEPQPTTAAQAAPEEARRLVAGLYEVTGYTTVRRSGQQRRIRGTVIIARSAAGAADPYTATFDLETEFADARRPDPGRRDRERPRRCARRRTLAGTAETRILMASIPGLDPSFPWIPGRLGPRGSCRSSRWRRRT